jgi:membrane protein YdbS with pleckstrin-like domain
MNTFMSVAPHEKEIEFRVDFDVRKGTWYQTWSCQGCCCFFGLCCGAQLLCFPCTWYFYKKESLSQKCTVTDKSVKFKSGWLNVSDKNIPLDRIQDVNVYSGLFARMMGTKVIKIETAGSSQGPTEAILVSPVDAERVRDVIIQKRDALVSKPLEPIPPMQNPAELTRLTEAVLRIEKQIESLKK